MQENKNSKKHRIERLKSVLDDPRNKNLHPEDEKHLVSLSKRLKESAEYDTQREKVASEKKDKSEKLSLEPRVTIHVRGEKTVTKVDFVKPTEFKEIIEEKKKLEIEDEDIIEVEKVEVEGPRFIEVEPKETAKPKKDEEPKEKPPVEGSLMEWEAVEKPKPEAVVEKKVEEWEPIDVGVYEVDEKEKVKKKEFVEVEEIPDKTKERKKLIKIKKKKKDFGSCPKCGVLFYEEFKFCPDCGNNLLEMEEVEEKEESNNPEFVEIEDITDKVKEIEKPVETKDEETEDDGSSKGVFIEDIPEDEPGIEDIIKIDAFKDLDSVDDKTAVLLYDSGFTSVNDLEKVSAKDIAKIKGIKRKQAKEIKKEIEETNQWQPVDLEIKEELEDKKIKEDISSLKEKQEEIKPIEAEETAEGELTEEQVEKEDAIEKSVKIDAFKEIKTIDDDLAVLLYDNGFRSVDVLTYASVKDIAKIKGIKRKQAKEIKKEIEDKTQWHETELDADEKIKKELLEEKGNGEILFTFEEEQTEVDPFPIGDTAEGELTEEQVKEEISKDNKVKIDVFKEMKSVDDEVAILLYDNGYKSVDDLKLATAKDLKKVKGVKHNQIKKIIKEIEEIIEESVKVKPIETGESGTIDLTKEQLIVDPDIEEVEMKELEGPVELSDNSNWEPIEEESTKAEKKEKVKMSKPKKKKKEKKSKDKKVDKKKASKKVEEEFEEFITEDEEIIDDEFTNIDQKILEEVNSKDKNKTVFKDIKSIDKKIEDLLIENGIGSIETLKGTTIKELTKIKGIRKKIAKEIKKEVEDLFGDIDSSNDKSYYIHEAVEGDADFDGFKYGDFILYEKEIKTVSNKKRIVRFFSKELPSGAHPIELPEGYEVIENGSSVPYLKKKK